MIFFVDQTPRFSCLAYLSLASCVFLLSLFLSSAFGTFHSIRAECVPFDSGERDVLVLARGAMFSFRWMSSKKNVVDFKLATLCGRACKIH